MKVQALLRIEPAGYFGVPDKDKVVYPASVGAELYSPRLDSRSGQLVGYGTFSLLRANESAIKEEFQIRHAEFRLDDNYLWATVEAESKTAGFEMISGAVVDLLRNLMVEQADFFRATLMQIETEIDAPEVIRDATTLMNFTVYNLDELRGRLRLAAVRASHQDSRLEKALQYHEHARLLYSLQQDVTLAPRHRQYLLASAYLFLWKAITAVLGEPGIDRDYQTRYRTLGYPSSFWSDRIQPLKNIRDDADVAHYDLQPGSIKRVIEGFATADQTCREVLGRYADSLVRGGKKGNGTDTV